MGSSPRVLVVTSMWPTDEEPWRGTAVKSEVEQLERLGVRAELEQIRAGGSWRAYASAARRALADRARSGDFDLIHAYYGHSALVARLRRGPPMVITYCGSDLNGVQRLDGSWTVQSRAEVAVFRQLARLADATITMSLEMEMRLPRACRPRNRIIPTAVDLDRFAPIDASEARRTLGWPLDAPVVLFVGDPDLPLKNYPLASAACDVARAALPGLLLKVAWEVAPEDIPIWLSAADALLFTSHAEGSPNAVKEAMAAALPVVSTPVGDVPERLAGVSGCFVRPAQPAPLAEAIVQAISRGRSPEARRAVAALSPERVAGSILAVYESVIADEPPVRSQPVHGAAGRVGTV